jgi:hypothetical protein
MTEEQKKAGSEKVGYRPEVLRARDIIPSPKNPASSQGNDHSRIPTFDLADDIMAAQRRVSAVRRRGPGVKFESEMEEQNSRPAGQTEAAAIVVAPEQDRIVAEIVARDIERLCRGDYAV